MAVRLSKFEKLVLHNQTAIMWALLFPKAAKATLKHRIAETTPLMTPRRKPKRRRAPIVRLGGAFMNDVGKQTGWR